MDAGQLMRCDCCNRRLNDYEATLKSKEFGVYMNTCVSCLKDLGIETVGRDELAPKSTMEDVVSEDFSPDTIQDTDYYRDIERLLYDDDMGDH